MQRTLTNCKKRVVRVVGKRVLLRNKLQNRQKRTFAFLTVRNIKTQQTRRECYLRATVATRTYYSSRVLTAENTNESRHSAHTTEITTVDPTKTTTELTTRTPTDLTPLQQQKDLIITNNNDTVGISDEELLDTAAAWTINRAADVLSISTSVVVGTLAIGKYAASSILGGAAEVVKYVVPETKSEENLPEVVVTAVNATKTVGDLGASVVTGSLSVVSSVGKMAGGVAGDIIKSSATSVGTMVPGVGGSETSKAIHRLSKTGFEAYTNIFSSIEDTAHGVVEAAKDSAVSVISHSLGKDTGKAVKDTVEVGQKVWDSVYTVKTLGARKLAMKVAKEAAKTTVKTVFTKKELEREQQHEEIRKKE